MNNKENVEIAPIEEKDLPIMRDIWNRNSKYLSSSNMKHTFNSLKEWCQTQNEINHKIFGLHIDEIFCGFMILHYEPENIRIKMTAIEKSYQNLGFGKKLLEFAINEAKNTPILTEVKIDNFNVLNQLITNKFQIIKYNKELNEYILKLSPSKYYQ